MRHGKKIVKLSGSKGHARADLRNLVTSLLHHEMIETTVPKAKAAARMAEKMITLGKKGTSSSYRVAQAFLLPPHKVSDKAREDQQISPPLAPLGYPSSSSTASSSSSSSSRTDPTQRTKATNVPLIHKVFHSLSERYRTRPGGYTRIMRHGKRYGDNAPVAIVSLVDGPRDVKFEMLSRIVGAETARYAPDNGWAELPEGFHETGGEGWLGGDERARWGVKKTGKRLAKIVKFRGEEGKRELMKKAREYADQLLVEEKAVGGHRRKEELFEKRDLADQYRLPNPYVGRRTLAGERLSGMDVRLTGLGLARGPLGKVSWKSAPLDRKPRFVSEKRAMREEAEEARR